MDTLYQDKLPGGQIAVWSKALLALLTLTCHALLEAIIFNTFVMQQIQFWFVAQKEQSFSFRSTVCYRIFIKHFFANGHWQQSGSRNDSVLLGVVSKFEDSLCKSFKSEHNSGTPFVFWFFLNCFGNGMDIVWISKAGIKGHSSENHVYV